MNKGVIKKIFRKTAFAFVLLSVAGASFFTLFISQADATVAPNGMLIYGDTTNVGNLKHRNYWNGTWLTEVSTSVGAASNVRWAIVKANPTRNEKAAILLKADGTMNVLLFNATSTNAWTLQFVVSGVGPTVAPFTQAVDMFYENLSGDLVVTYGKTGTNGSFFYRVWNGDTWTTETSQSLPSMAGPASWINAASRTGTTSPSDIGAISVIDETNDDVFAIRWTGSAWSNGVMLINSAPTTQTARAGVAFENASGKLLAVYSDVQANNAAPWKSNVFNGTSWGATTTLPNAGASTVGRWVSLASGPDDLIAFAAQSSDNTTLTTAPTFDAYIWSGTASTSAWIKGPTDTTAGTMNQGGADVVWEASMLDSNATPQAVFMSTQSTTALAKEYVTFTYRGVFSAVTTITGNNSDDIQYLKLGSSRSTDDVVAVTNDIDSDLFGQRWTGAGNDSISAALEANIPDGAANTRTTWRAFDFTYDSYQPWMRNWQWLNDNETSVTSQNATSSIADLTTYRLRVNLEETGSTTQFSASKKLQYTSSATPDDPGTTWTDVGAQGSGSIWRYANGAGTELASIGSQVLSSSTASGVYLESGYASTTHATTTVTEYDYAIESNGATLNTEYSFRLFDNEFGKPVLRKQDSRVGGKCGTNGISTCWYPAAKPVAYTILGNGTDPGNSTIAPGGSATQAGQFTLRTTTGTDSVTQLTINLGPTGHTGLSLVEIKNNENTVTYGSTSTPLTATTYITLTTPIPVTTVATTARIYITPKTHANMPAPDGAAYSVTASTTGITSTNPSTGTDTAGTTITVDNDSPDNVSSATVNASNLSNSLSWTNPADSDFDEVVVLRREGSAVADTPVEGTSYATTTAIGSSVVACEGRMTSCSDTGLSNGTAYHYKIFAKDSNGNYSATGVVPTGSPATPAAPTFDQRVYRFYENLDGTTSFGTGGALTMSTFGQRGAWDIAVDTTYAYLVGNNSSNMYQFEKRSLATGELDNNFGSSGSITGNTSNRSAYAVVTHGSYMYALAEEHNQFLAIHKRLLTTGAGDSGFGTTSNGIATTTGFKSYLSKADMVTDGTYLYIVGHSGVSDAHVEKRLLSTGELCTAAACGTEFGLGGIATSTYNGGGGEGSALGIDIDSTYMYITIDDGVGSHIAYIEKRLLSTGELCTAAACGTEFGLGGVVTGTGSYFYNIKTDGTYLYIVGNDPLSSDGYIEKRINSTGELCTAAICGTAFDTDGILVQDAVSTIAYSLAMDSTYLFTFGYDNAPDWRMEKRLLTTGAVDTNFGTTSNGIATSSSAARFVTSIAIGGDYMYLSGDDGTQGRLEKRLLSSGDIVGGGPVVGTPLAAQSTAATLSTAGQAFRMRFLMRVDASTLGISGETFKLQYAVKSGTCDTSFSGETYADVTTGTPISYYNNTTGADGDSFTAGASDPTDSGRTVLTQTYEEANNFTNSVSAISAGQDGEWDIALYDNGAPSNTTYCLRIVKSSGSTLDTYTVIPEITTTTASDPALDVLHYRWRNDDGSEANASYFQATDTAVPTTFNINIGTRKRLRFLIDNTGTGDATDYQFRIEQASSSCSTWYQLPASDTGGLQGWTMDLSGNLVNLGSTTDSSGLANPSGTFTPGYTMTASNQTGKQTITSSQFTELEYAIRPTPGAETGLLYCFRITNAGSTNFFTYTSQPQITLSSFNRQGGGGEFEPAGTGSMQTGGGQSGGSGTEGHGSGQNVPGGGQGGGTGDLGVIKVKFLGPYFIRDSQGRITSQIKTGTPLFSNGDKPMFIRVGFPFWLFW